MFQFASLVLQNNAFSGSTLNGYVVLRNSSGSTTAMNVLATLGRCKLVNNSRNDNSIHRKLWPVVMSDFPVPGSAQGPPALPNVHSYI